VDGVGQRDDEVRGRRIVTPIADMVEKMLAQGATPELVVLAIRAVESVASADVRGQSADARRTRDAERKREKRKVLKFQRDLIAAKANDVAASSADSPRTHADTCGRGTTFLSSFSESQQGMTEEGSKKKKTDKRSEDARARGQRMLAGAILTEEFRQAAIDLGAEPARAPDMWLEFVDYWVGVPGHRGVKLDWIATWRNDVRRKLKQGRYNGQRQQSLGDIARDLADEVRERERQAGFGGPLDHVRGG
jgi:hypothetical protein